MSDNIIFIDFNFQLIMYIFFQFASTDIIIYVNLDHHDKSIKNFNAIVTLFYALYYICAITVENFISRFFSSSTTTPASNPV